MIATYLPRLMLAITCCSLLAHLARWAVRCTRLGKVEVLGLLFGGCLMLGLADQITHQWAIAIAQLSILCVFVYDCVAFIRWQPHHDAGEPRPPTPPAITPCGFIVKVSALAVCLLVYWLLTRNLPAVPRACMSPTYMDIALHAATCTMLALEAQQAHTTVAFITPLFWIMGFLIVAPWNVWGYLVALIQGLRRLHPRLTPQE